MAASRTAILLVGACLFLGLLSPALAARTRQPAPSSAISTEMRPIRKVITLLQEMKAQVEKDAEADAVTYEKYMCWCTTNRKEKTAAIATAEQRIGELGTVIEEAVAKEGLLKTEIAGLKDDISADNDALAAATSVREKEKEAFLAEEADLKETRSLLKQAIEILAKVQLLQKQGHDAEGARQQAAKALLQLRAAVQERLPKFRDVMQRDLYDMFGSLNSGDAFLPKREPGAFQQMGKDLQPNGLEGQVANAKSYNSRSGSILGVLKEMGDEFARDLGAAQQEDFERETDFQKLRAAKLAEIAAATQRKGQKEAALADTVDQAAKAGEEKTSMEEALEADQGFMGTLEKNCASEDEEYKSRLAIRNEELRALAEALKILTDDAARDLYSKTESFVQLGAISSGQSATQARAVKRAVERIAKAANKGRSWALASLAVRMQLDAFTKVKEAMDTMLAELKKQQKEEFAKKESCTKSIDETEDSVKEGENLKEDLAQKHQAVSNEIQMLTDETAQLKEDIAAVEVSLKEAGEERKAQNGVYQTSMSDQRATINILKKAAERLKTFYSFSQTGAHAEAKARQEPGAAAPPPPASGKAYQKSALSGGVIQLLAKIIKDAEVAEKELMMAEQKAQEDYGAFVQTANGAIATDRDAVSQREGRLAEARAELSDTEAAQLANGDDLAKLSDLLKAHHVQCDFVLQYFDVRQQARQEEMDAIKDAKAILSGADFSS